MPEQDAAPKRRGPNTPAGKARSAMNALRHGLRARRFTLLPHEDPAEFAALARAMREAYAPADPVERELVEAIAVALWREIRADRIEAETLADIAPADPARTCGSDLVDPGHQARIATLLRYRAQTAQAVRRAQDALARHRRLVAATEPTGREAPVAATAAPSRVAATVPADAVPANDTNEFPESTEPPVRLELRTAARRALNPLDTPLLRALGRDPDLVLPVPGLRPEAWPLAQHMADTSPPKEDGPRPYRRVPHLPYGEWFRCQHLLAEMESAKSRPAAA